VSAAEPAPHPGAVPGASLSCAPDRPLYLSAMRSPAAPPVLSAIVLLSLATAGPPAAEAQAGESQAPPTGYQGAMAAGLELRRLGMTGRVLHIAAHPDDENTALLATLALGHGADVAYLSLTRGEGGQNSIGPELGPALGIVRSGELVAARRLDGARQFFARAVDYGYSKNAEEAFTRWPREELLGDVVEVIRRYRPDVVVSVWSGTERDGHGQHQASGVIAREAVLAAGDPARFPRQLDAGLRPHAPRLYYRSAFFAERPPDVELNTGVLDPLLGRSYHQAAMASRSLHRSQDQGGREAPGPRRTAYHRVDPVADEPVADDRQFSRQLEGAPRTERSLFEGVDTLLSQRATRLGEVLAGDGATGASGLDGAALADAFVEYEALAAAARHEFNPLDPGRALAQLTRAQHVLHEVADRLTDAIPQLGGNAGHAARNLHFHLAAELEDLGRALLSAANVAVDVVADREWVVPGQTFALELGVWNGGATPVRAHAGPLLPAGWSAVAVTEEPAAAGEVPGDARVPDGARVAGDARAPEDAPLARDRELFVPPGERHTATYQVTVAPDAGYTMPYYLDPNRPAAGAMDRWPDDPELRGLPFGPGPVRGSFMLLVDGSLPIALDREAVRIGVDRRAGEYERPVKVVPAASLTVSPGLAIVPTGGDRATREVIVRVRRHTDDDLAGRLTLELPARWTAEPRHRDIHLDDGDREFAFVIAPPPGVEPGEYPVRAVLATGHGEHRLGFQVIDYPHIDPVHLYEHAATRVRVLDVDVAPARVGYVEGAGDAIPDALDRLGVQWARLGATDLAVGDLDRFDVIITGIRAYELRDDLVDNNRRLLDWTRRGGTLVVQYNQYAALERDYTPWPVTIARPHGRVTDQNAPVRILEPHHPVFTTPNRISAADWDGWVQERGLYFLDSWDGPLTPLLAMSDPGEPPLTGGLLVAPLGEGTWVYSGLALFRQLPEGVPGAYRLLANLISLGARR
jgi:LmbE family N-acetylglucosaminyl deacetylase